MRLALVALVGLGGCGASVAGPHSTTLQAPPSARWTSATVITHWSELRYHASYIGGENTVEQVDIELVVQRPTGEGDPITLVSDSHDAFGLSLDSHELARRQFQLASSPDGSWLVISADHGATWLLVDPDSFVMCRHLDLHGPPEAFWRRIPARPALVLDVLGLDHTHDANERALARAWAVAHVDEPAMLPAVIATLFAQPDSADLDLASLAVIRARIQDPEVRVAVRGALDDVRDDHLASAVIATDLLWDAPDLQVALASWIARVAAPGRSATLATQPMSGGGHAIVRSVWNLARLVERDHVVTAEALHAALAVLAYVSKMLPDASARADHARQGIRSVWTFNSSAPAAAAVYALQILVASRTPEARQAIEQADFERAGKRRALEVHYTDVDKDYLVPVMGFDGQDQLVGDADAWFRWALDQLAVP